MENIKSKGIVLKEINYRNSDKLLVCLFKDLGKITITSRGGRNTKSKFLAGSQIFAYSNFLAFKRGKYFYASEISIIENFYNIRNNFDNLCYGQYFLEITYKTILENQEANNIMELLLKSLSVVSKNILNLTLIYSVFNFKFLQFSGYYPILDFCSSCNQNISEEIYFSNEGIVCKNCLNKKEAYIKISSTTIYSINYILNSDLNKIFLFTLEEKYLIELKKASELFINYYIDSDLKSLEFINLL